MDASHNFAAALQLSRKDFSKPFNVFFRKDLLH
jgi:hypothetical protein